MLTLICADYGDQYHRVQERDKKQADEGGLRTAGGIYAKLR
jgi:hypothetical protein